MRASIVIPFYNERDGVDAFLKELLSIRPYDEIIAVDDGSTDGTKEALKGFPGIKVLSYPERKGQSFAIWTGLHHATRDICVIMDGDGEIDPKDIEALLAAMKDSDICCGRRIDRKCGRTRVLVSKTVNWGRRFVLGDTVMDAGAMKAVRRVDVPDLPYFDGLHRFIPAILERKGLRLSQIPIFSRERIAGRSKYGIIGRLCKGAIDLLRVKWLLMRQPNKTRAPKGSSSHNRQAPSTHYTCNTRPYSSL